MNRLFFSQIQPWDEKRKIFLGKDEKEALAFAVHHFFQLAKQSIQKKGQFSVALSGGSTPKKIYSLIAQRPKEIDWKKVFLFWSDERAVKPDHKDSNYKMAMDAGFSQLPIPSSHIFRMKAEANIEKEAENYQKAIEKILGEDLFDLVMLGMGEDGHTASLFPHTNGLNAKEKKVVANYVSQKDSWRMSLTLDAINQSQNIVIYVFGKSKAETVKKVFFTKEAQFPVQQVGTFLHPALWILDRQAADILTTKQE